MGKFPEIELFEFSLVSCKTGYPFPTPENKMSDRKIAKEHRMKVLESNYKPTQPRPKKPKGFNESHKKDCKCQTCLMAQEHCSFRDKMVKK